MTNSSRNDLRLVKKQLAYRLLYPQVPAVLCSRNGKTIAAMPAVSCISLSNSPALIGAAVKIGSNTERTVSKSSNFSLCWLGYSSKSQKIIADLSSKGKQGSDKLMEFGIRYESTRGVPVLDASKAYVVCRKVSSERFGDHMFFVGMILEVKASKDFTDQEYWKFETYKPILYLGSNRKQAFMTI